MGADSHQDLLSLDYMEIKEYATSNHSWAVKFREYAKKAYGIDFARPQPPLTEMIINWTQQNQ